MPPVLSRRAWIVVFYAVVEDLVKGTLAGEFVTVIVRGVACIRVMMHDRGWPCPLESCSLLCKICRVMEWLCEP